jgi:uncharacterized protein YraI
MASLTNPAHALDHDPVELIGRDIVWLMSTAGDFTTNTKMAAALRAISVYATIEIVGTATSAGCMFGVSGCDSHVAAGSGANFVLLEAALDAIDAQTLTVKRIEALTFAT